MEYDLLIVESYILHHMGINIYIVIKRYYIIIFINQIILMSFELINNNILVYLLDSRVWMKKSDITYIYYYKIELIKTKII